VARCLLLICAALAGCQPAPAEVAAPDGGPTAASVEALRDLYELERLPRLRPGVGFRMFSSYDRTGGNDDGFTGKYSALRREGGDSVLAEVDGPGVIRRIYFAPSDWWRKGLLNERGERLRIYLDGAAAPAVDIPAADLFSGRLPQFPRPLVGSGNGGFFSFVPVAFRRGCKVVVEGTNVRFYQVSVHTLPSAMGVTTFSMAATPARRDALARAVKVWSSPGDLTALGLAGAAETTLPLDLKDGGVAEVELPRGGNMVRAVLLDLSSDQVAAAMAARLELTWDGAASAAVSLPAAFLLGQTFSPAPFQSLLVGARGQRRYNLMPMPYRSAARVRVLADKAFRGTLRLLTRPVRPWRADLAYLHAAYSDERPTRATVAFPWLVRRGRGHYVGTYLVTAGWRWLPYWMEGDERFYVNDRLVAHGTGHEEYFNTGWYMSPGQLDRPFGAASHGVPVFGLHEDGFRMTGYRWHLADPVPYDGPFRAEIEHGPYNVFPANYRSAAFFYDTVPGQVPAGGIPGTP